MDSFKNYCTCGGYARTMNGRPQSQPHMSWCPQYEEYAKWWAANNKNPGESKCPTSQSAPSTVR